MITAYPAARSCLSRVRFPLTRYSAVRASPPGLLRTHHLSSSGLTFRSPLMGLMTLLMLNWSPVHPYIRRAMANVAGPQLLGNFVSSSNAGAGSETCGGSGSMVVAVGVGRGLAVEVAV